MAPMTRRSNGAGTVFIKHGNYYGRWYAPDGGRMNRKLGPVRRPGTAAGLTRAQAEKRLRELMVHVHSTSNPDVTVSTAGQALMASLEARGCARSHLETVESHLRVHLVPFFGDRSLDRIGDDEVTRLLVRLRRPAVHPRRCAISRTGCTRCSSSRNVDGGSTPIPASSSTCRRRSRRRTFATSER